MINRFILENPSPLKPANDISVEQITDLDEQLGEILYTWKSLIEFVKELKSSAWLTDEQVDFIIEMFWSFSAFDEGTEKKVYSPMECRMYHTQIMVKLFFSTKVDFTQFRSLLSFKNIKEESFNGNVLQKFKDLLQAEIITYVEWNTWQIEAKRIVWEITEFTKSLIMERRVS